MFRRRSIEDAKHLLESSRMDYNGDKNHYNALDELEGLIDFVIKHPEYGIVYKWDF